MSYGIDFGALQTPDFLGGALQHYNVGKKMRQDRERQSALQMYAQDPMAGAEAMMGVDAEMGLRLREGAREQQAQQVRSQATQRLASGDVAGARTLAEGAGDFDLLGHIDKRDERQMSQAKERAERLAVTALTFKNTIKDPAERKAKALQMMPLWEQQGFTPEQIDAFQWDDASLDGVIANALDIKTAVEQYGPKRPDWKERKRGDGSTEWFDLNAENQPQGSAAPAGGTRATGSFDDFYSRYLAPVEGGYAADDGNGAPVNFGINQKANPDVDVRGLTPEKAKGLMHDRYWKASGADQLPPGLAEVHADTAINMGVGAAKDMLARAGNDPNRYLQLREQRYRELAANGKGKYLNTWLDRNNKLADFIGGGSDVQPYQVASAGPTPGPPSRGRTIAGDAPQGPEWEARDGALHNSRTGDWKDDPRAAAGVEPPAEAGLTPLGAGFYKDRVGRIYQGDKSGKMVQTVGIGDEEVKKTVGTLTGINTVLAAINEFDQATKALNPAEFGPTGKYLGDANRYAKAKAAATNLQMLLKGPEVYNLGVLAGPDLEILQGVVADPERLGTAIRKNQIRPSLTQLSTSLGTKYGGLIQAFGVLGGDPKGLPGIYKSPQGRYGSGGKPAETQAPTKPVPADAVALLKRNPQLAKDFDAWYGAGAAKRALGK